MYVTYLDRYDVARCGVCCNMPGMVSSRIRSLLLLHTDLLTCARHYHRFTVSYK